MTHKKKQKHKQAIVKIQKDKFYWIYLIGFLIILSLPLLNLPPWFAPPDWGKTVVFRIILSILVFIFTYQVLFEKNQSQKSLIINFWHKVKNRRNKIFWPFWSLIALLGIYSLATLFSADIRFSLWGSPYRGGGFITFASYIILAVLALVIIRRKNWQKIWDFSILIGVLVSGIAILQQFGIFSKTIISFSSRPPSTIGGSIFLGIYLLLLSFLVLAFAFKEKRKIKKILYFSTFLLFLFIILLTGSRAVYFGLLVSSLYFLFFFSKNLLLSRKRFLLIGIKVFALIILIATTYGVYYVNYGDKESEFYNYLEENRIMKEVLPRLSIKMALDDPRPSAWKISLNAIKAKPIFGYGPENFSIGFDKYYDPALPYVNSAWGSWWDRAHNFAFDIAVTAGIPALIIYLSIFATLFWQLQKVKDTKRNAEERKNKQIIAHGVQTAFIGYLVANFFSFDVYSTYLIAFLLISYALYIISQNQINTIQQDQNESAFINNQQIKILYNLQRYRTPIIFFSSVFLIWFIFFLNLKPLGINAEVSRAKYLAESGKCEQVVEKMDNLLSKKSYLDSYVRLKYIDFLRECAGFYPQDGYEYAKKGVEILKHNSKIQPKFTRNWILWGDFNNVLIQKEKDSQAMENLIKEAENCFKKAQELSPKRQETLVGWARTYLASKDYLKTKEKAEECITLNEDTASCYWYLGLSEIFLKQADLAKEHIDLAIKKGYHVNTLTALNQLSIAYGALENYKELVSVYKRLIDFNPEEPQYHASLAFVYKELKEYEKARQEALLFLGLNPEAKEEVELFLKILNAN